jgi:hypothetical protein
LIEHPELYLFFTKICFLNGKVPDGRWCAPSSPENPTSLQYFKERVLTDVGGATKMDSNRNFAAFYRSEPFHERFTPSEMTKDDQR